MGGGNTKKRIFDLTGVPASPKNKKEENLLHHKMKWSDKVRFVG